MSITLPDLLQAARDTLRDPKLGARRVLDLHLPVSVAAMALVLMAVISSLLSSLTYLTSAMDTDPQMQAVFGNPLSLAIMQTIILALICLSIHGIGRWFGGQGDLAGAIAVTAWLEFILILVQGVQLVLWQFSQGLAEFLGLVGLFLFIRLMTAFIKELHGFRYGILVFLSIIGTIFGLSLIFAVILVAVGAPVGV